MLHVFLATLMVAATVAEVAVMQHWTQRRELMVIERAATGTGSRPAKRVQNQPSPLAVGGTITGAPTCCERL